MKKMQLALALMLVGSATGAHALSIQSQAGEHYTDLSVGLGTESTGLYSALNWAHNDNDGDATGLTLGLTLPLGPLTLSGGGKLLYLSPKDADNGYAAAVGGKLEWPLADKFSLYGAGYYSPDSLSSGVNDYREAEGGVRWRVVRPLEVRLGYRYIDLTGKDGERDSVVANGMYLGAGASF